MNAKWFAGRLRELRRASGMTQEQLAKRCGLARIGIAQIETGKNSPSWETVLSLCEALGVGCSEFMKEPESDEKPRAGRPRKSPASDADAPAEPAPGKKKRKGKGA